MEERTIGYSQIEGIEASETVITTSITPKKEVISRRFLGILSNDWKDFIDPTLPLEQQRDTAISMRNYNNAMLKAYLKGKEAFRFGYNGRDSLGNLIPRIFPVLQEYIYK